MRILAFLLNPAIIATMALFFSVVWMLRDEKDKTRPLLVFALTINVFFGFLLTFFMSKEGGLLPYKYDHVLAALDNALGIPWGVIARPLQGAWRFPLIVVYQLMVPMMIFWFFVTIKANPRASVVLAYVGELVAGPLLYALFPGCGPIYAFGSHWLQPQQVQAVAVKLVGMPNAFPSLHVGTAFVFVLLAPGRLWRPVSLLFLALTVMATLATGEHYVIDLVAGLAFGSFAASVGYRNRRNALAYLAVVVAWSLTARFGAAFLVAYPIVLRCLALATIAMAAHAVFREWRVPIVRPAPRPELTTA